MRRVLFRRDLNANCGDANVVQTLPCTAGISDSVENMQYIEVAELVINCG